MTIHTPRTTRDRRDKRKASPEAERAKRAAEIDAARKAEQEARLIERRQAERPSKPEPE